jgi:hypothetical protein
MTKDTAQGRPLDGLLRRHGITIEMGDRLSECPRGWISIVVDLLRELAQTGCPTVDQVKQKMGELCVYLPESASDVAREAVDKAAACAARTCEHCGSPG